MGLRAYLVDFEIDEETGKICVSLPTLHDVADFGETIDEALKNLHTLASAVIEYLWDEGRDIPASDPYEPGKAYLWFTVEEKLEKEAQHIAGMMR
jgi:predicted RNase H-like HicB family nuclease